MIFEIYTPKSFLREFVGSIFFMSGHDIGNGIAFQRMQQTIIINLGTAFGVTDIYTHAPQRRETTEPVWINGKQEIPFLLENNGTTAMYAIGIRPGCLPWLTGLPAVVTNDLSVEAANWASDGIYDLREQLLECGDTQIATGFRLIEQYFCRRLMRQELSGLERIQWMDKAMQTSSVEQICRTLGMTRKRLGSEARHFFGGPVKQLQGLMRFNQTLAGIARSSSEPLSGLHEYYDQAHFINDFRSRAGITPLQYRKLCRLNPAIRQTPNFLPLSRETFLQFCAARD
ncbi:MAG: AraC family transcriptional regulator [Bacteroidetes bacterium]|nr:AraC family transcriptional regulator [Bacteroidota bacterium]